MKESTVNVDGPLSHQLKGLKNKHGDFPEKKLQYRNPVSFSLIDFRFPTQSYELYPLNKVDS